MGIHNFYCYSPSHTATDLLQLEGNSIYRNPQCGERPMDIGQNCTGCPTKILPLNLVGNVSSAFSEVFKNCKRDFKDQHWHQTPLSLHSLKKIENKTLLCNNCFNMDMDMDLQSFDRDFDGSSKSFVVLSNVCFPSRFRCQLSDNQCCLQCFTFCHPPPPTPPSCKMYDTSDTTHSSIFVGGTMDKILHA